MESGWPTKDFSEQVRKRSLHNLVYEAIVEAIHNGALGPGDRVNEVEIAERLGVSRSPVREALARLAHDGLVEHRPRRGAFVAEFTERDIREIREVRAMIEAHAARLACRNIGAADERRLRGLIDRMEDAALERDWTRTASHNARFHETIVELADNNVLRRVWGVLDPLAWLVAASVPPDSHHDPVDVRERHERLLGALLSGDPDQAEEGVRSHIVISATPLTERTASLTSDGS